MGLAHRCGASIRSEPALGKRLMVANQSFSGNTDHHAILDVYVGERGRQPYLPRRAFWR